MLRNVKAAIRRSNERARLRREYLAILKLDDHLMKDIGLGRSDIHARLDALNVPV